VNAITVLTTEESISILAGLASGEIQAYDDHGRLRASVHAGLSVWHLVANGDDALALADVVAWQIVPRCRPGRQPMAQNTGLRPLPTDTPDLQTAIRKHARGRGGARLPG